jgi:putative salt-induced outer membrane protein
MFRSSLSVGLLSFALAQPAAAQDCPCPPAPTPGWHGSAGLGAALTAGNTETRSYNARLQVTYDPKTRNLVKIDGLFIHASDEDDTTAHNASLGARDEYSFGRAFLYGEARYLTDRFKELDYLITPTVGAGYQLVKRETVTWAWDGGLGGAFEKLDQQDATSDFALVASESLTWSLSPTAKLTHLARGTWKANDFADAYYRIEAGLTASIARRLEMKVGGVVDVKNKPAVPGLKKHDEAFLASLLFTF